MKKILVCILAIVLCMSVLFVACDLVDNNKNNTPQPSQDMQEAYDYLQGMFEDKATITPADFQIPGSVLDYSIDWTLVVTSGDQNGAAIVDRDGVLWVDVVDKAATDINYTLTGTLTEGEVTLQVVYNYTVPAFQAATWEDYVAAAKANDGSVITIKGYVIGINSAPLSSTRASLWVMDADNHGYYVYFKNDTNHVEGITGSESNDELRAKIAAAYPIGTEVEVQGSVTTYGGAYEFNTGAAVTKTGNSVDASTLQYQDVTTAFGAVTGGDVSGLDVYQSSRISVSDAVMGVVDGKNAYFTVNGVRYVMYLDYYLIDEATLNALTAMWAQGSHANLKGVCNVYSNAYQIYPDSIDSIELIQEELTDEEKVDRALDNLTLASKLDVDTVLPTSAWATIDWSVKEGTGITINEGTAVLNKTDADQTVVLTATASSGAITKSKDFTVTVASNTIDWKDAAFAVAECNKLDGDSREISAEEYYFYGFIEDEPTADYCNFNLTDGTNSILVYGLYAKNGTDRYGSKRQISEIPFQVGDLICIKGKLQNYGGKLEIINAVEQDIPAVGTSFVNPNGVAQALEICNALADGATSEEFVFVAGLVTDAPTADYCNFNLGDGENTILVYGLSNEDGQRFGSKREIADLPIAQGDAVILKAKVQKYMKSGVATPELVNAVLIKVMPGTQQGGGDDPDPTPDEYVAVHAGTEADPYSVADAIGVHKNLASNEYTEEMVYVKGIIKSMKDGSYVQNIYLVDEAGAEASFLVYSCNYANGVTSVCVGDTVVIKGAVKNYNGTIEMTNVKVGNDTIHGYPTFISMTAGQGTIAVDATSSANATVAVEGNQTVGANHSTFTFTVEVAQGHELVSVKVNGVVVEAVAGVYTGTIAGETKIAVETKAEGAVAPVVKTISFADKANRVSLDNSQQVWQQNGITFTNDKASSTSNVGDYSNPVRCYKSSTVTIACDNMTKIVITCTQNAQDLANAISGEGVTVSVSGQVVTIVFASATNTITSTGLGQQVRISTIEVTVG